MADSNNGEPKAERRSAALGFGILAIFISFVRLLGSSPPLNAKSAQGPNMSPDGLQNEKIQAEIARINAEEQN
jgi:hypothetical protein